MLVYKPFGKIQINLFFYQIVTFNLTGPDVLKLEQTFLFQRLRVRAMDLQYKKKYWEYFRGEREYPYQPIPHPQGFFEPLRSYKNDFSDGNVG